MSSVDRDFADSENFVIGKPTPRSTEATNFQRGSGSPMSFSERRQSPDWSLLTMFRALSSLEQDPPHLGAIVPNEFSALLEPRERESQDCGNVDRERSRW